MSAFKLLKALSWVRATNRACLCVCASPPVSDARSLHRAAGDESDAGQGVVTKSQGWQLLHAAHHDRQNELLDASHPGICKVECISQC